MAKILMGLKSKNDGLKLIKDFVVSDNYIQLDIGNENLACIFPLRTGVSKIFKDLILQENKKNIIIFDINSRLLGKTAPRKLYNGYEIICLSENLSDKDKKDAIMNIKKSKKFIIYYDVRANEIMRAGKDNAIDFLFDEIKDFDLLTIIDEVPAFMSNGMLFLKKLSECKNNQIIFRFQNENQFSLKGYSEVEIKRMKIAGLDTELLLDFYKNTNILEVPSKIEKQDDRDVKKLLLNKYNFKNKKSGKSLLLTAPNIYEVTKYLERY